MADEDEAGTPLEEHPGARMLRLQNEIAAARRDGVLNVIDRLRRSLMIFVANETELRGALEFFGDPVKSLPLWAMDQRAELDHFLADIDRLLHNLLAAAKTLVDHSRRIMENAYKGQPLMDDYAAEAQRLFGDGLPTFVQGLRNYSLHYSLASMIARRTHTVGEHASSRVLVDRDALLLWDSWTAKPREWLKRQDEAFDLLEVVRDYETRVRELYQWIDETLRREHAGEVAAVEALVHEYNELVRQLVPEFR